MESFTKVPNVFIENMHRYSGATVKIFLAIWRQTIGWQKEEDKISYSQIGKTTGIASRRMRENILPLVIDGWVVQSGDTKHGYTYHISMDKMSIDNKSIELETKCLQNEPKLETKCLPQKKEEKEKKETMSSNDHMPYKEIILYLNEQARKNFRIDSKDTKAKIKARWNAGFTEEDFHKVIDVKCEQWLTDEKMIAYLRPETLFSPKFESYLNEHKSMKRPKKKSELRGVEKYLSEMAEQQEVEDD